MTDEEIYSRFEDIEDRLDNIERNLEVVYKGLLEVAKSSKHSNNGVGNIMNMFQGMIQ